CEKHLRSQRATHDSARGTAAERGYDWRWARYAKQFLARHPLCRVCQAAGRVAAATEVDHIVPVQGAHDARFWDEANHQPLCRSCHAAKTAAEREGRRG